MVSITRRRALAGAGSVGVLGIGGLDVESYPEPAPTFDAWTPAAEDWPARCRGPRRTAAALEATPPSTAPEVVWQVEIPSGEPYRMGLVVVDGTAYVGGENGVAAVDLEERTVLWHSDVSGEVLCHRGDTLYCAHGKEGTFVALEDDTGDRQFEANEPFHRIWDLLALENVLLIGDHGVLKGCDPGTGDVEWERDTGVWDGFTPLSRRGGYTLAVRGCSRSTGLTRGGTRCDAMAHSNSNTRPCYRLDSERCRPSATRVSTWVDRIVSGAPPTPTGSIVTGGPSGRGPAATTFPLPRWPANTASSGHGLARGTRSTGCSGSTSKTARRTGASRSRTPP